MDYSEVKRIANAELVEKWDHAFLVYSSDLKLLQFLESLENHKTVVLNVPPTAENLALIAFRVLDAAYRDTYGNHLRLEQVRLFETPNCWADANRELACASSPRKTE
jgi:6-pyruvoyltetrahydropterin/6-carboxytetrahydropterin synthase